MYAKTLIPGPHPVPALMATAAADAVVLLPQLLDRGWALFGEAAPPAAAGELVIGTDRLQADGRRSGAAGRREPGRP